MLLLRTNPDLNQSNIDELVIPPPKGYKYFEKGYNHPFESKITRYSVINAWWMSEFATLIYESEDKVREKIRKLTSNEPIWLNNDETHTQGLVIKFDEFVVVSFRGTELFRLSEINNFEEINAFVQDFITNITIIGDSEIRGILVHRGINDALNSVWEILYPILESESKPIWFTGHSLGGALAILAAFKWEVDSEKIGGVYTIGCPAIGGSEFKQQYDAQLYEKTFHHIYGEDLVTKIGQFIGNAPSTIEFEQVGQKINIPRVDVDFFENLRWYFLMSLIDHGPIFYLNSLWNQMVEQI
ncbi:MAG: Mbeg1-like protein [Xenococcus sp. (in: cyanobacteria)]